MADPQERNDKRVWPVRVCVESVLSCQTDLHHTTIQLKVDRSDWPAPEVIKYECMHGTSEEKDPLSK